MDELAGRILKRFEKLSNHYDSAALQANSSRAYELERCYYHAKDAVSHCAQIIREEMNLLLDSRSTRPSEDGDDSGSSRAAASS